MFVMNINNINYFQNGKMAFTAYSNYDKSAASVCHWVADIFYNFYFVKNHKITYKLMTTKVLKKIKHVFDLRILEKY
jgi:hypothetical protein